jgi:hypothetical protein
MGNAAAAADCGCSFCFMNRSMAWIVETRLLSSTQTIAKSTFIKASHPTTATSWMMMNRIASNTTQAMAEIT